MKDLQDAYHLSLMQRRPMDEITRAAIAAGRFVVVVTGPAHCRFTDAVVGTESAYISDYATREEAGHAAEALYNDWDGCETRPEVLPRLPASCDLACDHDDIPF